jgi:hypothetical protein
VLWRRESVAEMADDFLKNLPDSVEKNVRAWLAGTASLALSSKTYLARFAGGNAWMLDINELARIAVRGWSQGWTQERITAAIQSSTWYKSHVEQQRAWASLPAVDRQRKIEETALAMSQYWERVSGEHVDYHNFMADAEKVASGAVPQARWEYDQNEKALAIDESPLARERRQEEEAERQRPVDIENLTGQLELRARQEYLTPIDRDSARTWAEQIISNTSSEQDFLDWIRERSSTKFPQYAEKITQGGVPAQLFGDYLQLAREELESQAVTYDDPQVMGAIQQGMTLADFQTMIRKQPQWKTTRRAGDMAAGFAEQLLERFGKVAQ